MKKSIIINITFVFLITGIFIPEKSPNAAELKKLYDNSNITLRLPDKKELERIRKNYKYEKEVISGNAAADLLGSWIIWLNNNLLPHIFSKKAQIFWRFFPYLIIAVSAAIAVFALRRGSMSGIFSGKSRKVNQAVFSSVEDIHETDFDSIINECIKRKEYRAAVRYMFLKSLRTLSLKGFIVWQKEKTNRDYVNEIASEIPRSSFNELVYIFEYVWYGSFDIDKNFFERVYKQFNSFQQ